MNKIKSTNFPVVTKARQLDLIGIGNAIVDILIKVDDAFLKEYRLPKGSMTIINEQQANEINLKITPNLQSSGGSAANTLAGFAQLGGRAGFIGRVRDDKLGEIFTQDICSAGAIFNTLPATEGPTTARCFIFVTPDAQRTMCTFLGASVLIEPRDLDSSLLANTKILYLEGYLWESPKAKKTFLNAAKICKESGGKIALTLSDSFCVDRHRDSFKDLIDEYVDILFANEAEITSLFETQNLENALNQIKNRCQISAITCGEKGSILIREGHRIKIDPFSFGTAIDTTGAGDLYAGGFLYGYANNRSILDCGKMGSICAGHIVTQLGPRSNMDLKDLVNLNL